MTMSAYKTGVPGTGKTKRGKRRNNLSYQDAYCRSVTKRGYKNPPEDVVQPRDCSTPAVSTSTVSTSTETAQSQRGQVFAVSIAASSVTNKTDHKTR
jgi:hypothetical protein